ncbi:HAD-superfamily hydrolase, subfamily IIB [Thioflavicoccus mobilis 8321]|uniref:HAD-superfamily hydrolase, subfamily IIB n=1 Tax=Thioflavicoccus mobilis 8321 TaxID=765912 RepID=L0GW05_9GAMM|nr:HAD-IIB family hydrolase [Thioflavicoccus mobilis]AGA90958.1 HAD-superfamily hydrolase, subfamily IIB [Thioflavicoccus mobilis 8321]
MKILATDLDRTLLPNGHWPADEGAIGEFNALTERHGVTVVYVTGRNLPLAERAIADYGVRYPSILIGDVGTTIRRYEDGAWSFDDGWVEHVKRASPRWNAVAVREAIADVSGIVEQEDEHLNQFKQSYYVDHGRRDEVLARIDALVKGRYDEVIVYSYDSQNGKGLLDFLPESATKQTALEYVCEEFGVPKGEAVFCGDSGNDIFPLTAGFSGVLVRNADEQLVENVRKAMAEDPKLKVYFARGGFNGLSGYYTSGVIEGAYHYGIFA